MPLGCRRGGARADDASPTSFPSGPARGTGRAHYRRRERHRIWHQRAARPRWARTSCWRAGTETLEAAAARIRAGGRPGECRPARCAGCRMRCERWSRGSRRSAGVSISSSTTRPGNFYAPSATLSAKCVAVGRGDRSVRDVLCLASGGAGDARAQVAGRIMNMSMTLHYRGWPQMAHATAAKAGWTR